MLGPAVLAPLDSLVDTGDRRYSVFVTGAGEVTISVAERSGTVTWILVASD